jgi:hypothetical protein
MPVPLITVANHGILRTGEVPTMELAYTLEHMEYIAQKVKADILDESILPCKNVRVPGNIVHVVASIALDLIAEVRALREERGPEGSHLYD